MGRLGTPGALVRHGAVTGSCAWCGRTAMNTSRRALDSRKWIFATGALTGAAIALASLVILNPLTAARNDLRSAAQNVVPLEEHVGALRAALLNFQLFLERHVDAIVPGTAPTPTELANGAKLAQAQQDRETAVANGLRGIARTGEARDLDAAMKSLGAALDKMTPIAVGSLVPPATRARLIESERAALERLWNLTTAVGKHLADDDAASHAAAADHLRRGRTALLIGVGLDLLLVLAPRSSSGVAPGARSARTGSRSGTTPMRLGS